MSSFEWDAFVCHASEDKATLVVPLADELQKYGLRIWFDAFSLKVGDSLRESVDLGLANSEYGIVVLSHAFFAKNWPLKELNALFARHTARKNVILPVWHDISQQDLLSYSPLLSDLIAGKSSDGIPVVARALVDVIRPEALKLQTSIKDSQRIIDRIREQLQLKNPSLDYNVTFSQQRNAEPPLPPAAPGLVASVATDGVRFDFFAKDPESYNQNPVSGQIQFTREAWATIQESLRLGTPVQLSEEHLRGVSPDLYTAFGFDPAAFTNAKSLLLMPRSSLLNRIFRFRVRFAKDSQVEEFPYTEFKIVRAGTAELELESSGPQLPFVLTLIIHSEAGTSTQVRWTLSYAGHSIHDVYRAHEALKLLRDGGSLEFFDLEKNTHFAGFRQAKPTSAPRDEFFESLGRLIGDIREIAVAAKGDITWKDDISDEDAFNTSIMLEAVKTGRVSLPEGTVHFTQEVAAYEKLRPSLEGGLKELALRFPGPPPFCNIFGQTLELGEYSVLVHPTMVADSPVTDDGLVNVEIKGEMTFVFERYDDGDAMV